MKLIDAEDLWNNRPEWLNESQVERSEYNKGWNACLIEMINIIKNQPTIDAVPVVHGRWIVLGEMAARCSVCGVICKTNGADKTGNAVIHRELFQFCPNCWAKMDLEDKA